MPEPIAEDWRIKVEREDDGSWSVTGFRRRSWSPNTWSRWAKHGPVQITGLFAGLTYWFKPMEERVRIATERIKADVYRQDAQEREEKRLAALANEAEWERSHAPR